MGEWVFEVGLLLEQDRNSFEPARVKQYIAPYSKTQPESNLTDSDTKLRAETGSNAEAMTKRTEQNQKTAF